MDCKSPGKDIPLPCQHIIMVGRASDFLLNQGQISQRNRSTNIFNADQEGKYFQGYLDRQFAFVSQDSGGLHKNKTHNNHRVKDEFEYYN